MSAQQVPHVLLVDDDEDFAESLALLLRLKGHQVTVSATGADALVQFGVGRFDLVILDVRLPQMDGLACFERLRAIDPDARIVFVTGMRDEAVSRLASDGEALAVFDKPVQIEQLLELAAGQA